MIFFVNPFATVTPFKFGNLNPVTIHPITIMDTEQNISLIYSSISEASASVFQENTKDM